MVVDMGGGTTDIAIISLGGAVVSTSIKVAGNKFGKGFFCTNRSLNWFLQKAEE